MPKKLHIDVETFSSEDIKASGSYKYTRSLDFEILLVGYAFDYEPVKMVDLANGEKLPDEFVEGMLDPFVVKCAHNATFERNCFKAYGIDVPIEQWECSAVKAAYCGLPLGLDNLSKVLGLEEKGKLSTGKALIRFFCIPCKPTKSNGMRVRNFSWDDPEKWQDFKDYCCNDVEAERESGKRLEVFELPGFERINYLIDQEINDRGILVDLDLASNAVDFDQAFSKTVVDRIKELTGMDNPNSASQMKKWLSEALGKDVETLAKDSVLKLLSDSEEASGLEEEQDSGSLDSQVLPPEVKEVLEARLLISKSSTKKYIAMLNCTCDDNRSHGLFQFYGANRTGRWAGRLIQLQNLPQNHMSDLELAREVVHSGDYDLALMLYGNLPNVLSELIRTAFVAPEGKTLCVADFSAIEARVLSWIAQEEWRLDVFKTHGKIYEASAAMMFGVPIESVTKGSELRQRGKTAELALGYEGSEGALAKMDRENKIPPSERKPIVKRWRKANPKIVELWNDVEDHAKYTVKTGRSSTLEQCNISFHKIHGNLLITLPSGRSLFYNDPRLEITVNSYGYRREILKFMGMDQVIKQWTKIDTYGGKLVENITQAISRDILAYSMQELHSKGFEMVMHVHDEVGAEVPINEADIKLKQMCDIMGEPIPWAPGLPLAADGYHTWFYKKD